MRGRELSERDAVDMRTDRELRKLVVAHNRAKRTGFRTAIGDEAIEKLRHCYRLRGQVDSAIARVERLRSAASASLRVR